MPINYRKYTFKLILKCFYSIFLHGIYYRFSQRIHKISHIAHRNNISSRKRDIQDNPLDIHLSINIQDFFAIVQYSYYLKPSQDKIEHTDVCEIELFFIGMVKTNFQIFTVYFLFIYSICVFKDFFNNS